MKYIKNIEDVRKERLKKLKRKYEEEIKTIKSIAKNFKLKRVYIFGSFINGNYHFNSDIDIAVEGIDYSEFLKFYSVLLKKISLPVDVKIYEDFKPEIQKDIKRKGKIVYEKK